MQNYIGLVTEAQTKEAAAQAAWLDGELELWKELQAQADARWDNAKAIRDAAIRRGEWS